jgi:hypothetical protein
MAGITQPASLSSRVYLIAGVLTEAPLPSSGVPLASDDRLKTQPARHESAWLSSLSSRSGSVSRRGSNRAPLPFCVRLSRIRWAFAVKTQPVRNRTVALEPVCLIAGLLTERPSLSRTSLSHSMIVVKPFRSPQVPSGPFKSFQVPSGPLRSPQVPSGPLRSPQVPSGPLRSLQILSGPLRSFQVPSGPFRSSTFIHDHPRDDAPA